MASENIGSLFPTKIPGYSEAADIQAALRLYHYGSGTVEDSLNTNPDAINPESIAGYLKSIEDDIEAINDIGIGSDFVATQPTDVPDGFIWVDADANLAAGYSLPSVIYQDTEPTLSLSSGMLWVDKNSSPLTLHVYDEDLGWRAIGS